MKISIKWISDFFPNLKSPSDLNGKAGEISEKLPFLGLEIAERKSLSEGISSVLVAEVIELQKHPDADKLNVCQVNNGKETLQIVCGAPNVRQGMKVALAPVGSVLPGDFKIKPAKIRGVESFGMLCSESELGLADEADGIMDLQESLPVGSTLVDALDLKDEIWEIELTPDRADCLSHLGCAREIGRLLNEEITLPEFEDLESSLKDVPLFKVEVQAKDACPIYGAVLLEDVKRHESPSWMKRRLELLGHRSHNALVDITNYVVQELGHPLHAFDADKVVGSNLIVRYAKDGETLVTLDEEERKLSPEDLVIADSEKVLALAGVMGGLDSGVTENTKRILLESAYFNPVTIRKMAARHKIHSEASHRFERGVDPNNVVRAAGRATLLYKQLTDSRRRGAMVEIVSENAKDLREKQELNFDLRAFSKLVGIDATSEDIAPLFEGVGLKCQIKSPHLLRVEIPTHRVDLEREVDLIEEASRLLGYEKIPTLYPEQKSQSLSHSLPFFSKINRVRERLLDVGLGEVMPYCFISDKEKESLGAHPLVELENPLSQDWKYLRPNLSFGLLKVLKNHVAIGQQDIRVFDSGHVFSASEADTERSSGVKESYHYAWALQGKSYTTHWSSDKKSSDRKQLVDYYDSKGVFDKLIHDLSTVEGRWAGSHFVLLQEALEKFPEELSSGGSWIPTDLLHPTKSALIVWPGKGLGQIVGWIGELHPQITGDLLNLPAGLQIGVSLGEIRLSEDIGKELSDLRAGKAPKEPQVYGKITMSVRTPIVERDLSLVFDRSVEATKIEGAVRKVAGKLLKKVSFKDLYKIDENSRSLAFGVFLQDEKETLNDKQIQKTMDEIVQKLKKDFGAELRS